MNAFLQIKKRRIKLWFGLIVAACLLFSVSIVTANQENQKNQKNQNKIHSISSKIEKLQQSVRTKQNKKEHTFTELKTIEQQINRLSVRLRSVNKNIRSTQGNLKTLQSKAKVLQRKLDKQRVALAEQLRSAYSLGQKNPIQILLSPEKSNDIARTVAYYQAINEARQQRIEQYMSSVAEMKANQDSINDNLDSLRNLQKARLDEQKVLRQKERNRHVIIKTLSQQISTSQQRITELAHNKKKLQGVINNLKAEKEGLRISGKAFGGLQHQLSWPVKGRIVRTYGQIYDGRLRSNGVIIAAREDQPIRAIAPGEVIYAHWLRGYGNIVIIKHSDNYMTLYAHVKSTFVEVGEKIKAGEEIAAVGNSGGLTDPGLYFEIRYKGKARDPRRWFKT